MWYEKKTIENDKFTPGQKGKIEVDNKLQSEGGGLTTPKDIANYLRE